MTDDRDAVHPEADQPNPRPWAEPPAQREPDHDGQLYVGAAHPDTELSREEAAHHEPIPVDEAGEPVDRDDHDAPTARAVHDETAHHEPTDDERAESHESPSVMVAPLPPAQVVAVPATRDEQAEPAADLDHDGAADRPAAETPAETPAEAAAEAPTEAPAETPTETPAEELKPGDVAVAPMATILSDEVAQDLRQRWREAQLGFVDDPRKAAEDVRGLVDEAFDVVMAALRSKRDEIGAPTGEDTEQYRVTVRRSREFFDRLLSL
jgi:hypothetical protein